MRAAPVSASLVLNVGGLLPWIVLVQSQLGTAQMRVGEEEARLVYVHLAKEMAGEGATVKNDRRTLTWRDQKRCWWNETSNSNVSFHRYSAVFLGVTKTR